jgi:uncharacterized protein YdiU (UPF0061 family)
MPNYITDFGLPVILGLLASSPGIVALVIQRKRWLEGERQKAGADTGQVLTDTSLKLVTTIRKEMEQDREDYKRELEALRGELEAVRRENAQMRVTLTELEDVKDWAERLVHQVQSLGLEPVKMRVRTPRTNE